MRDFQTNRKKTLDLVVCTPGNAPRVVDRPSFAALGAELKLALSTEEEKLLAALPKIHQRPVGSVQVALEAKACMTAHQKAPSRLFDELNSSQQTIHAAADVAVAGGFALVNMATRFYSPTNQTTSPELVVTAHRQPRDGEVVINKIAELQRRSKTGQEGFDALGIVCVTMINDGSRVSLWDTPPAPPPGDVLHYESMVRRLQQSYESRF